MTTLTLINTENKNVINNNLFEATVKNMTELIFACSSDSNSFVDFEKKLLDICNEIGKQVLQTKLQESSSDYESEHLLIDNKRYKRHNKGTVIYHSLCGSIPVSRYTYRQTGIRNGPTVVPLELSEQLIERTTPALAYRIALGDAQCPGRQWEEQLHASHRQPPGRSTLERIAKRIGTMMKEEAPKILPIVRQEEIVHKNAVAVSVGLDRTTIPMEEKIRCLDSAPPKRRTKPYVRKKPDAVVVNYRMAYVGTVSISGTDGECLHTYRYGCSADQEPSEIINQLTSDLLHIQQQRQSNNLPELPMGIVQDGAPEMWNLVKPAMEATFPGKHFEQAIDRFHLAERLAECLKALKDPYLNRDVRMRDWSNELEQNNDAIDNIEKFIIKECNRLKKLNSLSAANAEILRVNLTYIKNNKHLMRYATLKKFGLPTGSGATEGACKSLIMIRAKGCGQRWHSKGVNSVLTLRGLYQSERLTTFWEKMNEKNSICIKSAA